MGLSENESKTDYDFFLKRRLDRIYISKVFPYKSFLGNIAKNKRIIKKVFEKREDNEFVKVKGEIVLRSSTAGRDQVTVVVTSDGAERNMSLTLQKFRKNIDDTITPYKATNFTFYSEEFLALLKFLSDLNFIDFSDEKRFVVNDVDNSHEKILLRFNQPQNEGVFVNKEDAELINVLSKLHGPEREKLFESLRNKIITKKDLDILSGRKDGLEIFKRELFKEVQVWDEPKWQSFFKKNSWIFGYGLDYKFLSIIQKEATVSDIDLDGSNAVKSDFLLGNNMFTVLVELKRPDTPLFEKEQNRSKSWKLSRDLTNAVSQILTQKAEWEIKSQTEQYDSEGNIIRERTYDPKTILIMGHTKQFGGSDRESKLKEKTFELYRRNSRHIEIITYDEIYEKASFIVNNENVMDEIIELDKDDLPF